MLGKAFAVPVIIVFCLVAQVATAQVSVDIGLNRSADGPGLPTYAEGDRLEVAISCNGSGSVDLYAALVLPDGNFYCLTGLNGLGAPGILVPLQRNCSVAGAISLPVVDLELPLIPEGIYSWVVGSAAPGTGGPSNTPQWLQSDAVSMRFGSGGTQPVLSVSKTSMDLSGETSAFFSITNSGGGTLSWTISGNADWASVDPTSGSTTTETDDITVTVDITGLAPGEHTGTVVVDGGDAGSATVTISLTVPAQGTSGVTDEDLGLVHYSQAPRTWSVTIPQGFQKVEVGFYGAGTDEVNQYGGWMGYLKLNGDYAWKFLRYDQDLGGIIHDYIQGGDVLETSGRGTYLDVTSMVHAGENTLTYYHYTEGDGIGVKLRIHATGESAFPNIGAAWSEDGSAAVVADTNGEIMVVRSGSVVWLASNGESFVVEHGDDGLPARAVIDGYIVLYRNWTSTGCDMAVIAPDGTITTEREVTVDSSVVSALGTLGGGVSASVSGTSSSPPAGTFQWSRSNLAEAMQFGGYLLSAGLCGASVGTALASGGLASPTVALACGSYIVETAQMLTPEDSPVLEAAGFGLTVSDAIGCYGYQPDACAGLYFTASAAVLESSARSEQDMQEEIESAEAVLQGGGGAVQVSLTWWSEVDLDLHLVDPSGEEIYFNHKTSASGGYLDVDDTDGGTPSNPAIENIYFESNAPRGTYTVDVVYYSGSGAASFRVLTIIDGASSGEPYTGSLSSAGQEVRVSSFTY
jgi:hypothetical protein